MEKEIPIYYKKRSCNVSDCKTGDWVYNSDALLCYVEALEDKQGESKFYSLHFDCFDMVCPGDTVVYPLTLRTKQLADRMSEHRDKYYKANIMNPYFSRELEGEFAALMEIDDRADDAMEQYERFWKRLDDRLAELLGYAAELHIEPKRI